MSKHSELLVKSLALFYPFILLIGIYITVYGYLSPGGGFQGGAVISAVYICRYLISPTEDTRLDGFQRTEKLALILIILLPLTFLFMQLNARFPQLNPYYLTVMNVLISLKVACGFTIVFFRFVHYETR